MKMYRDVGSSGNILATLAIDKNTLMNGRVSFYITGWLIAKDIISDCFARSHNCEENQKNIFW